MSDDKFTSVVEGDSSEMDLRAALTDLANQSTDFGLMIVPIEDGVGFRAALIHLETSVELGSAADSDSFAAATRAVQRGLQIAEEIKAQVEGELT